MIQENPKKSATNDDPTILVNYEGNTSIVTLNRPKALNAMSNEMIRNLRSELDKWNSDPSVKVVIFKGSGRAFSAGGDLIFMYNSINSLASTEIAKYTFLNRYALDYLVATMRPIQIAIWDGIVMGGGVGVSIHSKIRIATENSVFAMPEAKAGLFTDVGAGYFLSRIRNHIGYFLGLTAMSLKGKELVQVGVADFFVKHENLAKLEQEIILSTTTNTTVEDLRILVKKYEEPVESKYANEELIEELFSKETLEEVFEAIKKSETNKKFTKKILDTLNTLPPLSLKVIFEHLKRGKNLDLKENLRTDLRVMRRFVQLPDTVEGLKCLLVDKSATPKWSYKSINEVPQEEVERIFSPFETDQQFLANSKL